MHHMRKGFSLALSAMLVALVCGSGPDGKVEAAQKQRPHTLTTSSETRDRTTRLTGDIHWHDSLAQAEENARSQGKMIFWVNILGSLSGAT